MTYLSFLHSIFKYFLDNQKYHSYYHDNMISKKECIDKYELILASNGPKEFFISNKNGTVCVVGTSKRENIKITGWKSVQAKTL